MIDPRDEPNEDDWAEWFQTKQQAEQQELELTHNHIQDMTHENQRTEVEQIPEERGLRR